MLLIGSMVIYSLAARLPIDLDVIRDRNSLFRETADGLVENVYTLKLINKDRIDHEYVLTATGIKNMQLKLDDIAIKVPAGAIKELSVRLEADPADLKAASNEIYFKLFARDAPEQTITEKARFIGPRALR